MNSDLLKSVIFLFAILYSILIFYSKNLTKIKLVIFAMIFFDLEITIATIFNPLDRLWFIALLVLAIFKYKSIIRYLNKFPYRFYIISFITIFILLSFFDNRYNVLKNLIRSILYFIDSFGIFLLIGFFINTKEDAIKILKFFYYLILICAFYSLFVFVFKINPYNNFFSNLYGIHDVSQGFIDRSRMAISSFIINPHRNGVYMGVAILVRLFLSNKTIANWKFNRIQILYLIVVLIANVLSNSRASYIAFFIGILIYSILAISKKNKIFIYICLVFYLLLITIYVKIDFNKIYIPSLLIQDSSVVIQSNKNNQIELTEEINGSSLEMRAKQFLLSIELIKDNWLVGNGFRWLKEEFGLDPTKKDFLIKEGYYGFESFIFMILVDTGLLGLIAYSLVYFIIVKYNLINILKRKDNKKIFLAATLNFSIIFTYLSFIMITGEGHITPLIFSLISILTKYIQIVETSNEV